MSVVRIHLPSPCSLKEAANMKQKYLKRGVKRQHDIIEGVLELLESIAKLDGVKKVVPAVINYSPKRGIKQPFLSVSRDTITGIKVLAHSKGKVQEVFIICDTGNIEEIKKIICEQYDQTKPKPHH